MTRLDSLQYFALAALLAASTLNGLSKDWAVLGTEITVHPDQAVMVFLVPLLAYAKGVGRFHFNLTWFDWVVCGFVASNLVSSLLFSASRNGSLQGALLLGLYASMYFVVRQVLAQRPEWLPAACNWVIGLGIAQAAYALTALLFYSLGLSIGGVQRGHLTESSIALEGTFWEANLLGAYLALVALFIAVRYVWNPERAGGRTLLFGLFITSLALPLTLTRAAGMAFALGMVAVVLIGWGFRKEIRNWGRRTAAIALVVASVLLLTVTAVNGFVSALSRQPNFLVERWVPASWIPLGPQAPMLPVETASAAAHSSEAIARSDAMATRRTDSTVRQRSRSSVEGRLHVWLLAGEGWRSSPIFGQGTLGGGAVVKDGWWYSSLVQASYDTGLVGLSALLWIYAGSIFYPLRTWLRRRQGPLGGNLLAFGFGNAVLFLTSQFSSFLFVGFPWIFLGVTMAAVQADSTAHTDI